MARKFSAYAPPLAICLTLLAGGAARAADAPDPGIDHSMFDMTVSPCQDFFRFSCGGWIARNPIPPDESSWRVDQVLSDQNLALLRAILDKAAAQPTDETRKIGDFYASCLDEARIEMLGIAPLKPDLDRIAALMSKDQLPELLGHLQQIGADGLFSFYVGQDSKDAESEIASLDQGGLGLPDRDYYLKTDAASVALRKDYVGHVARLFALTGEAEAAANADAETVLSVETKLAKGALDRVARRDPVKTYNLMDPAKLDALTPGFAWTRYFAAIDAPPIKAIDVAEPKFLQTVDQVIHATDLASLKTYLRWHLIDRAAEWLPKAFVDENFAFEGKRLTGTIENRPRWKRCVMAVDGVLGEDLGKAYVAQAFPPEAKARTQALVDAIADAFRDDLKSLDWMGKDTKAKAVAKLDLMRKKIGYPDHWRDYSRFAVMRGDALGNIERASGFELWRSLDKIGKPVDHGEWEITPPTVNAYYDSQMNDINLPAGILQPPFFSPKYDDAVNFGATGGSTVGHEMTHGFDDEGRQYDGHGNLVDWWTKGDAARFQLRAKCLVDQFSSYTPIDKLHINGELTLGENTADLGGVRLGYMALMKILAVKKTAPVGGFTPEQRYFIAYAQSWCGSTRPETVRLHVQTDPHSPPEYRVNGIVADMPEFRQAFACKAKDPMVRQKDLPGVVGADPDSGGGRRIALDLPDSALGQRLDRALALAVPELSRARLQALLAEGRVTRNGAVVTDASARAKPGQHVVIDVPAPVAATPQPQDIPLAILFEDDEMLVIDKPAGLVVHPGAGNPDRTLVNALLAHCGEQLSGIGGVKRPGIVHRLDKDTSGLMVVAKTDRAHASLSAQLQSRTLKRVYNALVWGHPVPQSGRIEGNIGRSPSDRTRMALVKSGGRAAVTHYRTLERLNGAALVECRLETGRTHQIRVHMASLGNPLVGDPAYGAKRGLKGANKAGLAFRRQALHATQISFRHPVTAAEMCYISPVPHDFATLMAELRINN